MKTGDRVKYTEYALRARRDYWQRCGREPHKSNAKQAYEDACALRGTILETVRHGTITVQEDGGAIHQSLSYLWELA